MRRTHWTVLIVLLLSGAAVCLGVTFVGKTREDAARMNCQNNLRQLGGALCNYAGAFDGKLPIGTIPNPGLPVERRLSWYVSVSSQLEIDGGRKQLLDDRSGPADLDSNLNRYGISVRPFICPAAPPDEPRQPITHYVGMAGVGADAATLQEGHPRAGVFGYDRQTMLPGSFIDGRSNTILLIETSQGPGKWAFGGPSTVRGFDPDTMPYIGEGRPFGGWHAPWFTSHRNLCNIALGDGSVRAVSATISPEILEALATLAGHETLPANW